MSLSEEFIEAFAADSFGAVEFCSCGRTHFQNSDEWDWEEGELEGMIEESKTDERVIMHHDYIQMVTFDGGNHIIGCDCNEIVEKFELVLNQHSLKIAKYLKLLFAKQQRYLESIKVFNEL